MDYSFGKVLVTGASGFLGRLICIALEKRGFRLRGFDRSSSDIVEDFFIGNLEDFAALRTASIGIDTILHLAACADDADFATQLVPCNVLGVYNMFEAARIEGARRVIIASSCRCAGPIESMKMRKVGNRAPADHYALTKIWAEDMGRMYSHRFGLHVLAARLGWVVRSTAELEEMSNTPGGPGLFLSHRDLVEFICCCLTAQITSFQIVYAVSSQIGAELFDMQPALAVTGFKPRDTFPEGLVFNSNE